MIKLNPYFTLCIPVYNSGEICENAIQTALQQDFDDFEIVIVDDYSTDNSWDVLSKFKDNPRIKLYRNKQNVGMTKNWDNCLQFATGKFIGFVHHDDAVSSNLLKDAYEILEKHPNTGILAFTNHQKKLRPLMGKIDAKTYFNYTFSMVNIPPPSETIFIKTKDLHYDEAMVYCPEVDIYLKISHLGYDAFHSEKNNVVRNPSGWTGSVTSRTHYRFDRFQDNLYILKKWGNDEWLKKNAVFQSLKRISRELLKRYIRGKILGSTEADELIIGFKKSLKANDYFKFSFFERIRLFLQILPTIILKTFTSFAFLIVSKVFPKNNN